MTKYECEICKLRNDCDADEEYRDMEVCPHFEGEKNWYERWQETLPRLRKTFDNHKITVIEPYKNGKGEFLYRKDSWSYAMCIIIRKGVIIVYGDIRPAVILSQTGIDLAWLRGSVNDPNYLMEKNVADNRFERGEENAWYLVAGLQCFVEALDNMGA